MKKQLSKLICLPIFIINIFVYSQIPIELNHPASIIAKRLSARGKISLGYFGNNSMSAVNVDNILNKSSDKLFINSLRNIKIPIKRILSDSLSMNNNLSYIYNNIFNINFNIEKKYFYNSVSDSTMMWIRISENSLFLAQQNLENFQSHDQISFKGIFDNQLYVSTTFSMFRHPGNQILILNNYKNEWTKYFPDIDMTFWYLNNTSLYLKSSLLDIEFANSPFSWGWSSGNSPVLSANATPFNRISLYKNIGKLNFEYFHGSLIDNSIDEVHNQNLKQEKFIAGHRVKYEVSNDIHASISELVIYGNRSPEIAYMNPLSFFWVQEHNLGDLDNILIAADLGYRAIPGCIIYSTLLLDELSWKDLFNNWWGNKFSYQLGLFLSSENMSLPDLRIEYTATRPWTYTHPDFSYSHREQPLGAANGPASKTLLIESFYLPSPRMVLYGAFENNQNGIGEGSGLLDNYDERNQAYDWSTEFLLEDQTYLNKYTFDLQYLLSTHLRLKGSIVINHKRYLSNMFEEINEKEKSFIIGADFDW